MYRCISQLWLRHKMWIELFAKYFRVKKGMKGQVKGIKGKKMLSFSSSEAFLSLHPHESSLSDAGSMCTMRHTKTTAELNRFAFILLVLCRATDSNLFEFQRFASREREREFVSVHSECIEGKMKCSRIISTYTRCKRVHTQTWPTHNLTLNACYTAVRPIKRIRISRARNAFSSYSIL